MSVAITDLNVDIGVPGGAIQLPTDTSLSEADLAGWAESVAFSRLAPNTPRDVVAGLSEALLEAAADSRTRHPALAFSFCPQPEHGELARIEVRGLTAEPNLTVDALAAYFGSVLPISLEQPETVRGDLPIGQAVRARHRFQGSADEFGEGPVMQTVAYAIRTEGVDGVLLFTMTWQALFFSDELFELADKLAATLQYTRPNH